MTQIELDGALYRVCKATGRVERQVRRGAQTYWVRLVGSGPVVQRLLRMVIK